MSEIRERLAKGVAILAQLEQRRRDTRSRLWGHETEYLIIARELRQLESDILRDPGPLASSMGQTAPEAS